MKIVGFEEKWLPQAQELLWENYQEEREHIPFLPDITQWWPLGEMATNGLGVAAVEGDRLLGYLCVCNPWTPAFRTPDVTGVFSPLHAHAARKQDRVKIYRRMYQAAAEKWVEAGASSHAIALFAHDLLGQEAFYVYGFGMRCMDLMRRTEADPAPAEGVTFMELPKDRSPELHPLRMELSRHLSKSPCFMLDPEDMKQRWLQGREEEPPRMFVAVKDGGILAYIEVGQEGENFVSNQPGILNICGAYCRPEGRGTGVAGGLLRYLSDVLHREGVPLLGVDCESINPTALGFWPKHFEVYTHSVVRRIDENVLKR